MQVLFVEDNALNRVVVREMLMAGGIDMSEAEDGAAGLEMIDSHDYDLVLMDLRMPRMDGVTAIRRIRARRDRKAQVPVIVLSADTGPAIDADCRAAGADEVIQKPVSLTSLYQTIDTLMARRGGEGGLPA